MMAVPTRELSGQNGVAADGRQARSNVDRFGTSEAGSVTSARLSAACSGSKRRIVVKGGCDLRAVAPGAPSAPAAVGAKPRRSQPVGVKVELFSE